MSSLRKLTLCFLSLFLPALGTGEEYQFAGRHSLISYLDCDRERLADVDGLLEAMDLAVAASGATILAKEHYIFEPNGLTLVYLLSESHASIHTYPEHGACFVDLFTCGEHCDAIPFHEKLSCYLLPQKTASRHFMRGEEIEEISISGIRDEIAIRDGDRGK